VSTQDAGLQAQRTSLAWSRTAVGFAVNAILVLRTGLMEADPLVVCAGAAIAATAVLAGTVAIRRRRQLAQLARLEVNAIGCVFCASALAACSGLAIVLR
jgi:uncharacterized membrane protein YidH (DUF202 family)